MTSAPLTSVGLFGMPRGVNPTTWEQSHPQKQFSPFEISEKWSMLVVFLAYIDRSNRKLTYNHFKMTLAFEKKKKNISQSL